MGIIIKTLKYQDLEFVKLEFPQIHTYFFLKLSQLKLRFC